MTKHLAPGPLQAFFDQAVSKQKTVSFSDGMFMQLMLQSRPAASFAPGIDQIGRAGLRTYGYARYSNDTAPAHDAFHLDNDE